MSGKKRPGAKPNDDSESGIEMMPIKKSKTEVMSTEGETKRAAENVWDMKGSEPKRSPAVVDVKDPKKTEKKKSSSPAASEKVNRRKKNQRAVPKAKVEAIAIAELKAIPVARSILILRTAGVG